MGTDITKVCNLNEELLKMFFEAKEKRQEVEQMDISPEEAKKQIVALALYIESTME